jgi:hypothetical protein
MSEKSHVGMGYNVCPITGEKHSESIVLDKRMEDTLEKDNFLGLAYGPEAVEKLSNGYVALIEVNSQNDGTDKITLAEANRTGTYCFVKKELVRDMFRIEEDKVADFQFVSAEIIKFLTDLKAKASQTQAVEEPEV